MNIELKVSDERARQIEEMLSKLSRLGPLTNFQETVKDLIEDRETLLKTIQEFNKFSDQKATYIDAVFSKLRIEAKNDQ